jgi:general secretion pathway protein A
MTKTPLLQEIATELGMKKPPFRSQVLLDLIHQRVMKEYAQGRRIVLLVDEAHFLASNSLHILRTLSNLETSAGKLLTTILFAEENFVQRLKHPRYASLRGRISIETEIPPLSLEETEQYVKFRLLVAGGQSDLFSGECYPVIYRKTKGIAREISKLADNALLEAYMEGKRIIEPETVEASLLKV